MTAKNIKYRITADPKVAPAEGKTPEQLFFHVTAADYKAAWVAARTLCRVGGKAVNDNGSEVEVPAGQFTVRKVFTTEKRGSSKPKVVTMQMLLDAAKEHGVSISQKLQDIIDKLQAEHGGSQGETTQQAA